MIAMVRATLIALAMGAAPACGARSDLAVPTEDAGSSGSQIECPPIRASGSRVAVEGNRLVVEKERRLHVMTFDATADGVVADDVSAWSVGGGALVWVDVRCSVWRKVLPDGPPTLMAALPRRLGMHVEQVAVSAEAVAVVATSSEETRAWMVAADGVVREGSLLGAPHVTVVKSLMAAIDGDRRLMAYAMTSEHSYVLLRDVHGISGATPALTSAGDQVWLRQVEGDDPARPHVRLRRVSAFGSDEWVVTTDDGVIDAALSVDGRGLALFTLERRTGALDVVARRLDGSNAKILARCDEGSPPALSIAYSSTEVFFVTDSGIRAFRRM